MGKTVCVIDDDEIVRVQLADILRNAGHTALEAHSADDGVSLIRKHRAEAAIVDILMPDRDGLEVIGQLRREAAQVRIVAISGGGRLGPRAYLDIARQLGADVALAKPVTASDLLEALNG